MSREAVRVHADRFRKPRFVSFATLLTASRRYHTEGAVATITVVPGLGRLAVYACGWLGAAAATALAIAVIVTGRIADVPLGTPGAVVVAIMVVVPTVIAVIVAATGLARRIDARRRWSSDVGEWLVGDVASRRHGAGDEVMADITADADAAGRTLVLRVHSDNQRAVALYARHGFTTAFASGEMTGMTRPAKTAASQSSAVVGPAMRSPALLAVLLGLLVTAVATGVMVRLYWATPVASAAPIAVVIAAIAAGFDVRERRVPNLLTAIGFALTVVVLVYGGGLALMADAGIGVAIMAGPLLAMHVLTRNHTPGLGDVKLAAVLGLTVGAVSASAAYLTLLGILLAGALFGVVWKRITGERSFPLAVPMLPVVVGVLVVWAVAD